jgi:hypothetical protein
MLVLTTYAKIILGQGCDPKAPLLQFRVKGRFAPEAVGGPEGQFTTNPKDLSRHWAVCAISETTIRDLESRSFPWLRSPLFESYLVTA